MQLDPESITLPNLARRRRIRAGLVDHFWSYANPEHAVLQEPSTWLKRLRPLRWLLAPISFIAGAASFLLVQRQESLAQWLALALLLSWLTLLAQPLLVSRLKVPAGVLQFGLQAVHQETFFFCLPFFLATVVWSTPQAVFAGVLGLCALVAMWDPLYYRGLATRAWLYHLYQSFAVFVAALVCLPMVLHLQTSESLAIACAATALTALPGMFHKENQPGSVVMRVGLAISLAAVLWWARPWIPPATLWVASGQVTTEMDRAARAPGAARHTLTVPELHAQGLYAYTAIHAPRGLQERVYHRWLLNGKEVDRIALTIEGGRESGYRAWSYKKGFPAESVGKWEVQVVTISDRMMGVLKFEVR